VHNVLFVFCRVGPEGVFAAVEWASSARSELPTLPHRCSAAEIRKCTRTYR